MANKLGLKLASIIITKIMLPSKSVITAGLLLFLTVQVSARCSYSQNQHFMPYIYDGDSFAMNYTQQICKEYIGDEVCCNQYNAILTAQNLKQVDGAFSTKSGGCDICAINIKRFWCEYACSPRQANFLKVSQNYSWYPDPQKPGQLILAQEANLTVEADTACAIYNSCKRVPFVTSVSAMSSPAGFLNFQGHNAIDNARQFITVFFTYNKSEGLYFNDHEEKDKWKGVTNCSYTEDSLHGFDVQEICSCNSCEQSCNAEQGFKYTEASIFEGFNISLVGGIYGFVVLLAGGLTIYRVRKERKLKRK